MGTTYFKATRPDGTDFRTGTLHHEVGAEVFHPTTMRFNDMRPNDPGTYLSTSVEPGQVLTGGSWPCALWRVEPIGRTVSRTDGAYSFKRGMRGYRVVESLPAHLALGPNGEQVAALVERARTLTLDECQQLRAARGAARDAARGAARDAAWDAAWDAARGAAWGAAARGAARGAAWDAARDAAWALLLRDLITTEHFNVLYGSWAKVIDGAAA